MYITDKGKISAATIIQKSRIKGNPAVRLHPEIRSSKLMKIFEDELRDTYWAEKALIKAIPKMIKSALSGALIAALENHLSALEEQVERLEQVFAILGKKAIANRCNSMDGLIKETAEAMEDSEMGDCCDTEIISSVQKIIEYETDSYATLSELAETLGIERAVALFQITLDEENAVTIQLAEVAATVGNNYEFEEMPEDEESTPAFRR